MDAKRYQLVGVLMVIFASIATIVFSFMPWAAIKTATGKTILYGWEYTGNTIFYGAICLVLGALWSKFKKRALGIIIVVFAGLSLIVSIAEMTMISSILISIPVGAEVAVKAQWGLYLVIIASLITLIGGLMLSIKKKSVDAY